MTTAYIERPLSPDSGTGGVLQRIDADVPSSANHDASGSTQMRISADDNGRTRDSPYILHHGSAIRRSASQQFSRNGTQVSPPVGLDHSDAVRVKALHSNSLRRDKIRRDNIREAIDMGLRQVHKSLGELSGGNFVEDEVGDGTWVDFYTEFLGDVAYIFGEYTWADGRERYIVYEDQKGRIKEYDDADGMSYLLSHLANPGEVENMLATRRHRDIATLEIVPPRRHDLPTEPFESRLPPAVVCKEDM